jgi:hypothetical protein
VVGFLPITIDTPNNRAAMPDADYGAWTTTEEVCFTVRFRARTASERLVDADCALQIALARRVASLTDPATIHGTDWNMKHVPTDI